VVISAFEGRCTLAIGTSRAAAHPQQKNLRQHRPAPPRRGPVLALCRRRYAEGSKTGTAPTKAALRAFILRSVRGALSATSRGFGCENTAEAATRVSGLPPQSQILGVNLVSQHVGCWRAVAGRGVGHDCGASSY